jgi:hypothetical protein
VRGAREQILPLSELPAADQPKRRIQKIGVENTGLIGHANQPTKYQNFL